MLQLITAEYLYKVRPGAHEGEMTQVRSAMVNTNTLASLSEELGMGHYLFLGKGITKGGGRNLKSLLANAFEAVLGAVFLDQGYDAAYHYYLDRFRSLPEQVEDETHKGRLQQVVQEKFGQTPFYDSAGARGTGQGREYTAVVFAGEKPLGSGHAHTKQEAEQKAAKAALEALLGNGAVAAAAVQSADKPVRAPRTRSRRAAPAPTIAAEPELQAPQLTPQSASAALPEAISQPAPVSQQFGALPAETIAPSIAEPSSPSPVPAPRLPRVDPPAAVRAAPVERPPDPPRFEFGAMPAEPAPAQGEPEAGSPAATRARRSRTRRPRAQEATPAEVPAAAAPIPAADPSAANAPAEPAVKRPSRPRRRTPAKTPPVVPE